MKGLIRADMRRILRKKGVYIFLLILSLLFIFMFHQNTVPDQIAFLEVAVSTLALTMIATAVFFFVFSDELQTGSMQCAIGRGLSRRKLAGAKLVDCLILTIIFMVVLGIVIFAKNEVIDLHYTPTEIRTYIAFLIFYTIQAGAYLAIGIFALFLTWSMAVGLITIITLGLAADLSLKVLQSYTHMGFWDISLYGLIEGGYRQFAGGIFPWKIIPATLFYLIVPAILTGLVLDRKELDL